MIYLYFQKIKFDLEESVFFYNEKCFLNIMI